MRICESLLKPVNNDGLEIMRDEIEIYVKIMDIVHALLI